MLVESIVAKDRAGRGRAVFKLSVVVPAYNEAEGLVLALDRIAANIASFPDHEVIVVDDGSSDETAKVLRNAQLRYPTLKYILLSRNYGHQNALRAGMQHATGDCVACLDADLQHPPELLGEMVRRWLAGADIISCIRQDQKTLPLFKRTTSRWFYRILSWLSGMELVPGSSDFRLLDRNVVAILNHLPETDLFYRGIIPTLGFRVSTIEYEPHERACGESHYTLRKMVRLALNGIVSTSTRPLRLATYFAFVTAFAGMSFLAYVLYIFFIDRTGVPGWASTVAVMLVIGTMQLLVLGVIGEYLGQVLKETRRRPPYNIAEVGGLSVLHDQIGEAIQAHVD